MIREGTLNLEYYLKIDFWGVLTYQHLKNNEYNLGIQKYLHKFVQPLLFIGHL